MWAKFSMAWSEKKSMKTALFSSLSLLLLLYFISIYQEKVEDVYSI